MEKEEKRKQSPIIIKEAENEIAFIDDLTKLHNRRYLNKCLSEIIKKADKNQYPLSIFMIDADKFKEVNDSYGHLRGDKVLIEVANLLTEAFREYDEIIRYAGDEFVVILPMTVESDSLKIAKRLIDKISQYVFKGKDGQPDLNLTLSLGLALYPRDAKIPEKLISRADEALYLSKREGGNRVSVFTDVPDDILNRNKILEVFPCSEIIDRKKELKSLKDNLDVSFEQSTIKTILISAPAGLGKTRLQTEIRKYGYSKEGLCFSARYTEVMFSQPYQVISANLERLLKSLKDEAGQILNSMPEEELYQLINLEPALKNLLEREIEVKEYDEKEARFYLFKALINIIIKLAELKPFIITFDNFQWIDVATLNLINHLISNVNNERVYIICAFSESELSGRLKDDNSLNESFEQLKNDKNTVFVELKPFTLEDTKDMIKTIFKGLEFEEELNLNFQKKTEGNPYFIEEALKKLVEKGSIFFKDEKWYKKEIKDEDIPASIKNIIHDKFKNLDEETKQFLSAAAIMGQEFNIDILQKMIDKNPGYLNEMIDRAKKAKFIDSHDAFEYEFFNFRNRFLWQLLYGELQGAERDKLHKKFAEVKEEMSSGDAGTANTLAYHFKKAKENEKASEYEKIARDKAMRNFVPSEAREYLKKYLQDELKELKKDEEEEQEESAVAEKPLEQKGYEIITKIIISLRAGIINFELYPAGSKVRIDSVKELYRYFESLLKENEVISFSQVESALLVNGEELKSKNIKVSMAETMVSLLKKYRIQSISYQVGLTERELDVLLSILSKKGSEIDEAGGVPVFLKKENVKNIKVNLIRYKRILKKKIAQPQEGKRKLNELMLIKYLLGKSEETENAPEARSSFMDLLKNNPTQLAKIFSEGQQEETNTADSFNFKDMDLKEKVSLIEQILKKMNQEVSKEDLEQQGKFRESINNFILTLQPKVRSQVLKEKNLKDAGVKMNALEGTIERLTDDQLMAILRQECQRFKESHINFDDMKDCVKRFLPDESRRIRVLKSMEGDFLASGFTKEQFQNLLKPELWHELSFKDKVKKIESLASESFLDQEVLESTKQVFYELLSNNKEDVVINILGNILANLKSEKVRDRFYIAAYLNSIIDVMDSNGAFNSLKFILDNIIDLFKKDPEPKIYSLYAESLQKIIGVFMKGGKFDLVCKVTTFLKDEFVSSNELADKKKDLIKDLLKTTTGRENIDAVIDTFKAKVEGEMVKGILFFADDIGEGLIDPLIDLLCKPNKKIDPYDAYLNRRYMAEILNRFSQKALEALKFRLSLIKEPEALGNVIEILGYMGDKSLLDILKTYEKHNDQELKARAKKAAKRIEQRV